MINVGNVVGYMRFSPTKECGPILASQIQNVISLSAEFGGDYPIIYIDADKTGSHQEMHQLRKAVNGLNKRADGKNDLLVIDRLERLGHLKGELESFFISMKDKNIILVIGEKHAFLNSRNVIFPYEWDKTTIESVIAYIVERYNYTTEKIKGRIDQRKRVGKGWGRPKVELTPELLHDAKNKTLQGQSLTDVAKELDIPYSVLRRRLKEYSSPKNEVENSHPPIIFEENKSLIDKDSK